jgi:tRNA (uracil-5-)-methyltransferase
MDSETEATLTTEALSDVSYDLLSSEHYKLRLNMLPKYIGISRLKKHFAKYDVKPVKIKKHPQWEFAYITFKVNLTQDRIKK